MSGFEVGGGEPNGVASRGQETTLDDDSLCLPLPPEFEDPEGWMSERRDYWLWLGEVAAPTRRSWLRHRWMLFCLGTGETRRAENANADSSIVAVKGERDQSIPGSNSASSS